MIVYWDDEKQQVVQAAMVEGSGMRVCETPRGQVVEEARFLIEGDRNNAYGPPTQDFGRTAEILTALGYTTPDGEALRPHDIALFLIAVKMSRLVWTPEKRDSWVDIAGYAGCGYECVLEETSDPGELD